MMNNRILMALTLAAALSSAQAYAQTSTWAIDPNHSSVNFDILHMGVSHVHGALGGVKGTVTLDEKDVTKSMVTATVDTTTVSTGVEPRDKHLKSPDFFDVEKYPAIAFKSTGLSKSGDKLTLTGDLTLNGVTKSISLDLDGPTAPITAQGKTISGFSASGKLKRADYQFGTKSAASAMLGDDVKFTIDVEIDKK